MTSELASALRAWRDRVQPSAVGMPTGGIRRSPGLRREELSALAGVSVDYLTRLEQGRATNPSPQVLASLSRALRLSVAERDLLFRSAGVLPPSPSVISRHLSPGLHRILDRLVDTPVGVFAANWDLVEGNRLWSALFAEAAEGTGRGRNLAWRHFALGSTLVIRSEDEDAHFAREMVFDLQSAAARYPDDRELVAFVHDLRAFPEFEKLWKNYGAVPHISERKTVDSSVVGLITLDCDILMAADSDLRLVVYTAEPGSEDADKLDLLRVAGIQALA